MKKLIPFVLFAVTAVLILAVLAPKPRTKVVVVAVDLPAGRVITADDVKLLETDRAVPAGTFKTLASAVGQQLTVARTAGDVLGESHFAKLLLDLAPNERAVGIDVTDSSGLAGLLKAGQRVAVVATVFDRDSGDAYSKVVVHGLRVLYIPSNFRAVEPVSAQEQQSARNRTSDGVVVLAVPVDKRVLSYVYQDGYGVFPPTPTALPVDPNITPDPNATPTAIPTPDLTQPVKQLAVNVLELLASLNNADNTSLMLVLEPDDANEFLTGGLFVPSLLSLPPTPTPQPAQPVAHDDETMINIAVPAP